MKKKYVIRASETVYYWKEIEAESESEIYEQLGSGDLFFTNDDITDADYFDLYDITEVTEGVTL